MEMTCTFVKSLTAVYISCMTLTNNTHNIDRGHYMHTGATSFQGGEWYTNCTTKSQNVFSEILIGSIRQLTHLEWHDKYVSVN